MEKKVFIHAKDIDEQTLNQFEQCVNNDFVKRAALMPDAHLGYVAPIGAVIETKGVIVPAWVGFDIGCGVCAIKLSSKEKNLFQDIKKNAQKIYSQIKRTIPMGLGETNSNILIHEKTELKLKEILNRLSSKTQDKALLGFIKQTSRKHLGTLGSGNHFISIGVSEKKKSELWLVIHSGSRGIGHRIAEEYMKKSSGSKAKETYENTFAIESSSILGIEYLNFIEFALDYALLNRLEMAYRVTDALKKVLGFEIKMTLWANKNHNHVVKERGGFIHRKGATPAMMGERGIIPANMRDGSYLVEGKGSSKFLFSSSHGAGRKLSRKDAKQKISIEEFKKSVRELIGEFNLNNLDEAPMAYKPIKEVMSAQKESIKIIKHIIPIINWQI